MFKDVWKPQNLDLLALHEIVIIKNYKVSGLRLKMVFLMIMQYSNDIYISLSWPYAEEFWIFVFLIVGF